MKFDKIFVTKITEVDEFNKRFKFMNRRIRDVYFRYKNQTPDLSKLNIIDDYNSMRNYYNQLFTEEFENLILRELDALENLYPDVYKSHFKHGLRSWILIFLRKSERPFSFNEYISMLEGQLSLVQFNFGYDVQNTFNDLQSLFQYNK